MASTGWVFLLFLPQIHTLLATSSALYVDPGNLAHLPVPFVCHPDQAKVLLQLKKSFHGSATRLSSWRDDIDCCLWEGVDCDASSGNVTVLDLNNRGLSCQGKGLDPAVFSLTSLSHLDLRMNDLQEDHWYRIVWLDSIPATGFERFTMLTHLNLADSGLYGQIPIGISKLVNLVSLDLSSSFGCYNDDDQDSHSLGTCNRLRGSNFGTLVANLSNLRELYLDGVDLSNNGEKWCTSLAKSVPRLQVLSLATCSLSGPFHKSLSRLQSLIVINLQGNYNISAGPFPYFFLDFLNLTELHLSMTNIKGWFPTPFNQEV